MNASAWTPDDLRRLASIREALIEAAKTRSNYGHPWCNVCNRRWDEHSGACVAARGLDDVAFLLARIAPPTGAGGGATAPDSREGMDAQPGQVVIVRSVVEYVYTARRCSGQMPCDLAEWTHECNNWLLFDQDDGGYHAEVADEDFQRDFAPAPPLSPAPEGASAEPPHEH